MTLPDRLRGGVWGDPRHLRLAAGLLLAVQALLLLFLALWQHGAFGNAVQPGSSDFVSFYAAGRLALAGTPALAYDQAAHHLVEQAVSGAGAPYQYFFYPPVFLLLCAPLATLPYFVAFGLFQAASLAALLLALRGIFGTPRGWLLPVLACPAVFWTIGLGQNAFLTAALFAAFTSCLERRPLTAGLALGALCYKPHFGLLAPVALAAGGHWRAFAAAAGTLGGLVVVSGVLFGWDSWAAYLQAFAGSHAVYGSGRIDYAGMVTPFGAARLLGLDVSLASTLQAGAAVAAALIVAWLWRLTAADCGSDPTALPRALSAWAAAAGPAARPSAGGEVVDGRPAPAMTMGPEAAPGWPGRSSEALGQPRRSAATRSSLASVLPLRAAALASATLLAIPMALLYDTMLLLVAAAWLVRDAQRRGWRAGEAAVLAGLYPLLFLLWPIGTAWHVPLGPLASAAVLGLCVRRALAAQPASRVGVQALGATP